MNKLMIVLFLLCGLMLAGCSTEAPPAAPGVFGPVNSVDPFLCNESTQNTIYYNNETDLPMMCDGNSWEEIGKLDRLGVYAYINNTVPSYCAEANTWYIIEGNFLNTHVYNFYVNESLPGIVY